MYIRTGLIARFARLRYKMLLVQCLCQFRHWTNSFCTVLGHKNAIPVGVDALVRQAGQSAQIGQRVLVPHGHVAGWLQTPHAAACEGAPLSREAVAQQDVRAGGPAPGTASLSARQEVPAARSTPRRSARA